MPHGSRAKTAGLPGPGLLLLMVLGATPSARAVTFANTFVRFEMPARWRCDLEAMTWVCQSWDEKQQRDALIVVGAKHAGESDGLSQYEAYLRQPRQSTDPDGKPLVSRVLSVQRRTLHDIEWVDSLHDESELPGFRTRYLATVKDGLGVLVTFSIRITSYPSYEPDFAQFVQSLKMKSPLGK